MTEEGLATIGYALILAGGMFATFGGIGMATHVEGSGRILAFGILLLAAGCWAALRYGVTA